MVTLEVCEETQVPHHGLREDSDSTIDEDEWTRRSKQRMRTADNLKIDRGLFLHKVIVSFQHMTLYDIKEKKYIELR